MKTSELIAILTDSLRANGDLGITVSYDGGEGGCDPDRVGIWLDEGGLAAAISVVCGELYESNQAGCRYLGGHHPKDY